MVVVVVISVIRLPIHSNERSCVFAFLKLFLKLLFLIFQFSFEARQPTKTKIAGKDNPYLEGIEAKFQQDSLMGFAFYCI